MTVAVAAPEGAEFEYDEVKTARGQTSLGQVPLLTWKSINGALAHYGEEGVSDALNGTSLRVSFQSIARRLKIAGKTDDEIAAAQVAFKPGKRAGGNSTPVSRAKSAAGNAAEKLGDQADLLSQILAKIASGEVTAEDLAVLNG